MPVTVKEAAPEIAEAPPEIEIQMVEVSDIETNDYNPNAMEKEIFEILVDTVKTEGMLQPILVRPSPHEDGPKFMVVDGEHRYLAAEKAGLKKIAVVVVPYDEDMSKIRTISMNRLRGEYIPLRMAKLIVDLQQEYTEDQIRQMTGLGKEEFMGLQSLLDVPEIDFGDSPAISSNAVAQPISVTIMLMPDEHEAYHAAMVKAMELGGPQVVPLVAEEVNEYDKAMTAVFGLAGTKLRNVGMATLCKVFNKLTKAQQKKMVDQVTEIKEQ